MHEWIGFNIENNPIAAYVAQSAVGKEIEIWRRRWWIKNDETAHIWFIIRCLPDFGAILLADLMCNTFPAYDTHNYLRARDGAYARDVMRADAGLVYATFENR